MPKNTKITEVRDWRVRDFPIKLRRRIKANAALNGETISQCFYRLLKPILEKEEKER